MKKLVSLVVILLLSVSTLSFAAQIQSLTKAQTIQTIQGKTITTISLITLNGQLTENSFTGYFDKNGKITGQLSNKPDNDPQNDEGTWTVKADGTLCNTWQHWLQSKPLCVTIYKLKNGIIFVNQQTNKFDTLVLQNNIKTGNQLG